MKGRLGLTAFFSGASDTCRLWLKPVGFGLCIKRHQSAFHQQITDRLFIDRALYRVLAVLFQHAIDYVFLIFSKRSVHLFSIEKCVELW